MTVRSTPYWYWLPFAGAVALLLIFPKWTVDDAYISFRYGSNLYQHGVLAWNVGEPPVEGFTGYLLPLVAYLAHAGGWTPEGVMQWIGALAFLGTGILLFWMLRRLRLGLGVSMGVGILFVCSPLLYVHAGSGLETNVFMLCCMGLFSALVLVRADTMGYLATAGFGLMGSMAFIIRPEAVVLGALVMGVLVLRNPEGMWMRLALAVLFFLVPMGAFTLWRWEYFGSLLPNSFAAKAHAGIVSVDTLKDGIRFLAYYVAIPIGLAAILWIMDADAMRKRFHADDRAGTVRRLFWVAGIFIGVCCLVYLRANLYMNYASRFFAPFYPLILVLVAIGLDQGLRNLDESTAGHPVRARIIWRLLIAGIVAQGGIFLYKFAQEWKWVQNYTAIMQDEYRPAAAFLKAHLPPDARIVCYMDAGAIPYFSGLKASDFGRLNDPVLPGLAQGSPAVVDYFFSQGADAAVFTSDFPDRYTYLPEAHAIQADPRFADFQLVRVFGTARGLQYYQFVYFHRKHDPGWDVDVEGAERKH